MNCPYCQKVLPEKYSATYCPYCGEAIAIEEKVPKINNPSVATIRIRWPIFFGVLLAPALVTLLTSFLGRDQANEPMSAFIAFFGGIAAGIACGVMLAFRVGKTVSNRIGLGILFSCVFAVICITLNFFGCMAGGYQLRFN
jgi:hypothetical protein